MQTTLAQPASAFGPGLHTGRQAQVTLAPAPPDHGIRFRVEGAPAGDVRLHWSNRVPARMNTALGLGGGRRLKTVEHLAAALAAFGIDNALAAVRGPELPIFDGSARRWCDLIRQAGVVSQDAPRPVLRITRPVQVTHVGRLIRAEPAPRLTLDVTCERSFTGEVLAWRGEITTAAFEREIAGSRSSGQVSKLWTAGALRHPVLARWLRALDLDRAPGAGPTGRPGLAANVPDPDLPTGIADDILRAMRADPAEPVLRGARPGRVAVELGPWILGGARYPDEVVRHFALDLLGDLLLADAPVLGRIVAHRPTHALAYAFAATLARSPECWTLSPR